MPKAGPLARSRSKRAKSTEPDTDGHVRSVPSIGPSRDVKPLPPCGDLGRRLHSDEIVIGLALGSPGQSPLPPLPPDDREVDVCQDFDVSYAYNSPEIVPGALGTITEIGAGEQGIKRKGSKWKTFGSFFGKKASASRGPEASSFYQLDRAPEQATAKQLHAQDPLEVNALRRKRADSSRSNRTRTDSSNSTTKGENSDLLRRNSSRKKLLGRRKVEETNPASLRLYSALSAHAEVEDLQPPPLAPPTVWRRPIASLLQVEIPNVELERYSVMFGDVLDFDTATKQQPKTQPTLLARRQQQMEELQAVPDSKAPHPSSVDDLPKPPHKRDDSISSRSAKSPSFSLFPSSTSTLRQPNSSTACKPLFKPSPLSRSTTAPNGLAPPDRPPIHKSKSHDQDHIFVIVHSPADLPSTPIPGRRPSLDLPNPSANSTQASFFECPEFPLCSNPAVEMDIPSPVTKSVREAFLNRAFPARRSSMKKPSLPLEEPNFSSHSLSDSVSTTAEISIARQISISRRQRQLLVPVAPKLARQPRQPKLVNGISTPAARKSHHLMLEEA